MNNRLKLFWFSFFLISALSVGVYTQKNPISINSVNDRLILLENEINEIKKIKEESFKLLTQMNSYLKNLNDKKGSTSSLDLIFGVLVAIFGVANVSFIFITSQSRKKAKDELDWMIDQNQKMRETKRDIYEEKEKAFKSVKSELKMELGEFFNERINVVEGRFDDFKNNLIASTGVPIDNLFLGGQAFDKGDYEVAELHYKLEAKNKKENVKAWRELALLYLSIDRLEDALNSINEAIRLNEMNHRFNMAQLLEIKANILMGLEKFEEAKKIAKKISTLDPSLRSATSIFEECNRRLEKKDKQKSRKMKPEKFPKGEENE